MSGAFCFGLVIGYVTYRTLRRTASKGISDIASVIGALGGAAVLKLFPAESDSFNGYSKGLAIGFFSYLFISVVISWFSSDKNVTKGAKVINEFLGD